MAVKKRYNKWYIRFQHMGSEILMPVDCESKADAQRVEANMKHALRSGDYNNLDIETRRVLVRLFKNRKLEIPEALREPAYGLALEPVLRDDLSLWQAIELTLKYPDVRASQNRERHKNSFVHILQKFGKDYPVKRIWIPQIKEYLIERQNEGAANSTINKEKATLSIMFRVLTELQHMTVNPARLVRYLSENEAKRHVYLSFRDFHLILARLPEFFVPIAQTAYYTGMRRGEVLGLTWRRVDLKRRIIDLTPLEVKERDWKRVPIHKELVAVFETLLARRVVRLDNVFTNHGEPVTHKNQVRWCWDRHVVKVHGLEPPPHFHDLRHTWKTNARRSGMDEEIREAIMGHATRIRTVSEGYGWISDEELVRAIDQMTFDHGVTKIVVASRGR